MLEVMVTLREALVYVDVTMLHLKIVAVVL